jgi:hypothetical protein
MIACNPSTGSPLPHPTTTACPSTAATLAHPRSTRAPVTTATWEDTVRTTALSTRTNQLHLRLNLSPITTLPRARQTVTVADMLRWRVAPAPSPPCKRPTDMHPQDMGRRTLTVPPLGQGMGTEKEYKGIPLVFVIVDGHD